MAVKEQDSQLLLPGILCTPLQVATHERLLTIEAHEHTGFVPFTEPERNHAFTLLSFLDDDPEMGVATHLSEIHSRAYKVARDKLSSNPIEKGKRAAISRLFEFHDYALNAKTNQEKLVEFQADIEENHAYPMELLRDAYPDGHVAFNGLVRFTDAKKIVSSGVNHLPFNPFTPRESRWGNDKVGSRKNKTLFDVYTHPEPSEIVLLHIGEELEGKSIHDIDNPLREAIINEETRFNFWLGVVASSRNNRRVLPVANKLLDQTSAIK